MFLNDFSGEYLEGIEFEYMDAFFSYSNFSNCKLAGASFKNIDLSHSDFTNADLSGADLSGADLDDVILTNACLDDVILIWKDTYNVYSLCDLILRGDISAKYIVISTFSNGYYITINNILDGLSSYGINLKAEWIPQINNEMNYSGYLDRNQKENIINKYKLKEKYIYLLHSIFFQNLPYCIIYNISDFLF